jgi:hypothetical protein
MRHAPLSKRPAARSLNQVLGGGVRVRLNGAPLQRALAVGEAHDAAEAEADRVADRVMRMPQEEGPIQRRTDAVLARKCATCEEDEGEVQRMADGGAVAGAVPAPPVVHDVLRGPGQPLDEATRAFMEPRFGQDFSHVRVHTGTEAARSAHAVNARAYTVGRDVVFGDGQYVPGSADGARLLAHELTHTVQQGSSRWLRRTPARKVSCGGGPLNVPGAPPLVVADPVAVITAAEDGANQTLDSAIDTLTTNRNDIVAGAPVGFPTIGDATASGLRLLAINPDSAAAWRGNGIGSVGLLLRRLTAIRGSIGAGSFFFTCLGPANGAIPALPGSGGAGCAGALCDGNANAVSCGGTFRMVLCEPFWRETPEAQAETLLHESCHNFADFIQDRGREGNAGCYSRCAQVIAGVDPAHQRADLCPDP